jgi:membrane-bound lytic murein transglycosylase D
MIPKIRFILLMTIAAAIVGFYVPVSSSDSAEDPFPLYPSIRPNVEFWKKVYTRYPSDKGILHDSQRIGIIYGVIELKDPESPGAIKINRERIEGAKHKYIDILQSLGRGEPPASEESKRVADLFGSGAGCNDFKKAVNTIRCQVGQKDRFQEGLIRSGAYLPAIRKIFQQEGLPPDLVYLPHVESSFNPAAYSKFGAAGIWQFTRSTGRLFLTIDYTVDERRDPLTASRAAAALLKENYRKLGDWPLALTAYNHGVNGMLRAKQANGGYEEVFNHYGGRLFQFASRNFYSEFLAAREAAKDYDKYFGKLELHRPVEHPETVLEGYLALEDLVRTFKVDVEAVRRLNPSLREPIYRGEKYIPKGYRLRLPADTASAGAFPEIAKVLFKSDQKRSRFHLVAKGDTAGKIAKVHGVSLPDLIAANDLGSRAILYPGQSLRLPAPGEKASVAAGIDRPERRIEKPKIVVASAERIEAPEIAPAAPQPSAAEAIPVAEIVNPRLVSSDIQVQKVITQKGKPMGLIRVAVEETIGHYAEWLQVPAGHIRRINGFAYGKPIRIDQAIKIPLDKTSKERFEEKRFEYHEELIQDFFNSYRIEGIQTYRIQKGDNIWQLCSEVFEVPLWLFKTYNAGLDLNELKMSQPVCVPVVEKVASGQGLLSGSSNSLLSRVPSGCEVHTESFASQ